MSCGCSSSSKQHHNPATEGARTTASAAQGTDASRPGRPASTAAVNLTSFCSGVLSALLDLRLCNVAERTMSCGCSSSSKQHHNPATEGARTTASAAQGTDASRPGRPASTAAVNLTSCCSGVLSSLRFRSFALSACATLQRGQCHVEVVAATDSASTSNSRGANNSKCGAGHRCQPARQAVRTCSRPMHAARMR